MSNYRFLYLSHGILALFLSIILYVIVVAYTRHSGSTGLDMATIQKLRHDTVKKDSAATLSAELP